ncbi:alpha-N-arabinofuranosidase [Niabella terrae]
MKKIIIACVTMLTTMGISAQQATARLSVGEAKTLISRHIYGHFAEHLGRCIYDGFWVDSSLDVAKKGRIRMDVVEALKKIHIPNLRWPGGCFADEYHWRDGIGAPASRPKMVNTNWGGVSEDNSFGTHEFLELCELLGTEPYIAGNVGSGTVEEMAKWVEYLNSPAVSTVTEMRRSNGREQPWKVAFWGVGNESWGCGGNMTPEFYADQYRRYATYTRNYPGAPLKKIAGGANSFDYNWTEVLMKKVPASQMWGLSLHYYTIPTGNWGKKGSATAFDEQEYFNTMANCLKMETLVRRHSEIMDRYDKEKKVALVVDEWGIWTDVEPGTNPGFLYQQNSMRDALIAATTLNIFNNHADRVRMANLAQTLNVLQSVVLTRGKDMLLTPTYYVFDLFQHHMDSRLVPLQMEVPDYVKGGEKIPAINGSASLDSTGKLCITLTNLDPNRTLPVQAGLDGKSFRKVTGRILTADHFTDINSFEDKNKVTPQSFTKAKISKDKLELQLPPLSVVCLVLE